MPRAPWVSSVAVSFEAFESNSVSTVTLLLTEVKVPACTVMETCWLAPGAMSPKPQNR
jgi:hypothetical protein